MLQAKHLNAGWLHKPPLPPASCHILIIYIRRDQVCLVDTGIGLRDIADPCNRIGADTIDAAGFKLLPEWTAVNQLEALGIPPTAVTDIVLTHCDPDHVGGLDDFPAAKIHVSSEEKQNVLSGNRRYAINQLSSCSDWLTYSRDDCHVLGLPARSLELTMGAEVRLVPLFGHTYGHCGVAVQIDGSWMIHVGDAYYLREELHDMAHPISALAAARADDDQLRRNSLELLRSLSRRVDADVTLFGYHDTSELPPQILTPLDLA